MLPAHKAVYQGTMSNSRQVVHSSVDEQAVEGSVKGNS